MDSGRKTGFLGFLLNMKALSGVFDSYFKNGPLDYLLTFKLSQVTQQI